MKSCSLLVAISALFIFLPIFVHGKVFSYQVPTQDEITEAIIRVSSETGIRPVLLYGLIGLESGFGKNVGKTPAGWESFCASYPNSDECWYWRNKDCKPTYSNAYHYDEILQSLGYTDKNHLRTSFTCAMGFTQFEPNTWWLLLRNKGIPLSSRSPWVLADALHMTALHLDELGADGSEVASLSNAVGTRDKLSLQKYYCGARNYLGLECVRYANNVIAIARTAPEALFARGLQNQLELLERQKKIRRQRAIQEEIERIERERKQQQWLLTTDLGKEELGEPKEKEEEYVLPPGAQPKENPYIVTDKLLAVEVGDNYSVKLVARGGRPPYTWRVYTNLPDGLRLDSRAGIISGIPNATTKKEFLLEIEVMDSDGVSARKSLSLVVEKLPLSIFTAILPKGFVGSDYNFTLSKSGGDESFRWESKNALPDGLSLDSSTGLISGIPTKKFEAYGLNLKVIDSAGNIAEKTITISIGVPPLSIATNELSKGTAENFYNFKLSVDGGAPPYNWSVTSVELPPVLSLDPNTGVIFGIPSLSGLWPIDFKVTDSSGGAVIKNLSLEIKPPLVITTTSLQKGVVNTFFRDFISVTGGNAPYVWEMASGELPKGLSINSSGEIFGTPEEPKSSSFAVKVISGDGFSKTKSFTIEILDQLKVSTETIPSGTVGVSYSATFSASWGTAPYSWSVSPEEVLTTNGLVFDPVNSIISGVPKEAKPSNVVITVRDAVGNTATKAFFLETKEPVVTLLPLNITTENLSSGAIGVEYSVTFLASGGVPPYGWSIQSGILPNGLTLNAAGGVVSGIPSATGTSSFTIRVFDNTSSSTTKLFNIEIKDMLPSFLAPPRFLSLLQAFIVHIFPLAR